MMSRGPSQLPGRNLNITFDSDISSEGTSHIIRKRWMSKFDVGFSQLLVFNLPMAVSADVRISDVHTFGTHC